MKFKNIFALIILILILIIPSGAGAVLPGDPTLFNSYCVKIENYNDFLDYSFFLVNWTDEYGNGGYEDPVIIYSLENNKCQPVAQGFYGIRRLYAIKIKFLDQIGNLSYKDFDKGTGKPNSQDIVQFQKFLVDARVASDVNDNKKYNNIESIIKINKIENFQGYSSLTNINIDEQGKTEVIYSKALLDERKNKWTEVNNRQNFWNNARLLFIFIGLFVGIKLIRK